MHEVVAHRRPSDGVWKLLVNYPEFPWSHITCLQQGRSIMGHIMPITHVSLCTMELTGKWQNDSLLTTCTCISPKHYIKMFQTTKINFEKTVRLTSFQKPWLQSVLISLKFVHLYLLLIFWAVLCFTQFGGRTTVSNLINFMIKPL